MSKLTFLPAVLLLASCVSQAKYDEAVETAQMYQRAAHDNAEYIAQLESQLDNMQAIPMPSADAIDASYTADIDARLENLRKMLQGMGHDVNEVTLFEVEGGYGYSMSDSVVFDSGSDQLKPGGLQVIQAMAKEINSQPFVRIWIRGHTDSDKVKKASTLQRFPHGNIELSGARALEVAMALRDAGLPEDKLAIAGLGASQPVAANSSAEGKAKNRRVEIFVIDEETAQ